MWSTKKLMDALGLELSINQAPMAGANDLGLLPCAMLDRDKIRLEIGVIRQRTTAPLNVNFFCYTPRESYS